MRSRVARAVQAATYNEKPPLSCGYYSYWSGTGLTNAQLYIRDRFTMIGFPTNDDLACVVYCAAIADFPKIRSDTICEPSIRHLSCPSAFALVSANRGLWALRICRTSSASLTEPE